MSKVADRAYRMIRERILTGLLAPGEQLREEALATACGVSRTPVREALRKLETEQLIHRTDAQRSYVATLSIEEIAESFTLRAMLEGHAAARAAERITPAQIDGLVTCNLAIGRAVSHPEPDIPAFLEHNRHFHATVLAAAASHRLAALLGAIVEQAVVQGTARRYDREQLARSLAEHDELIVAFRHRDPEWAKSVMVGHIRRAFHIYAGASPTGTATGSDQA